MTFGEVVKQLRKSRGLNQIEFAAQLASRLGEDSYNQSNVSRIENDEYDIPLSSLRAIADVFGLSITDICALMDLSASDPQFSRWLAAYTRLSDRQREAIFDLVPER